MYMFQVLKKYSFLHHILFWLGVLLLSVTRGGDLFERFYPNMIYGLSDLIPQIIAAYLTIYYLIPKFVFNKKYAQFIFWILVSAYFISALSRVLVVHVCETLLRTPPFEQESLWEILSDWQYLLVGYFPSIYIMVVFFGLITFLDMNRKVLSLQKEKTTAELKALKTQLNPHFLFNTLNNIYSLSLDNSPKTSESIGKLSEILDYILYRCERKFVPITNEIALLENYISLEKLRYDQRLKVTFDKVVEENMEIAPLILLSLVENAFKHGAGEDGGSPIINISLVSQLKSITFEVVNTLAETEEEEIKTSIGLDNIKKQLDLIYADKYVLDIEKEAKIFKVTLTIQLL